MSMGEQMPPVVCVPLHVYVAHPFSSSGDPIMNQRYAAVTGLEVRRRGHFPFVPHLSPMDFLAPLGDRSRWPAYCLSYDEAVWEYDRSWLLRCDVLLLTGEWRTSEGCLIEERIARAAGLWIIEDIEELPGVEASDERTYIMEQREILSGRCRRRLILGAQKHGESWKGYDRPHVLEELVQETADVENYPLLHWIQQVWANTPREDWPPTLRRTCEPLVEPPAMPSVALSEKGASP